MAKVTMPQLGESVAEGTIGRWLKQPGDTVAKYEPLLEVITDKVNAEVPSPFAGVLREILVEEGATVPNNAEIAVIETEDEAAGGGAARRRAADGSRAPNRHGPSRARMSAAGRRDAPAPLRRAAPVAGPGPAGRSARRARRVRPSARPPTTPTPA